MSKHELIGKKFSVLDHGHVVLMDFMGSDSDVVQAARTAYQQGTKAVSSDRTLLRFLKRHRHTSPFESCQLKLHVKLPIFVERQWARHRTAGWNEVSARYSELPEEYYVPEADCVRAQSKTNKQGRDGELAEDVVGQFVDHCKELAPAAFKAYQSDLQSGVARELARISLPLGTYTEKVWWISLHNLLHFLGLRMDSHAQWEIRQYANVIGEQILKPLFPETYQAFLDYQLHAMTLSAQDQLVIRDIMARAAEWLVKLPLFGSDAELLNWQSDVWPEEWRTEVCRERTECIDKLRALGIVG